MALAVELYFDARTEKAIDVLRDEVHEVGVAASPMLAGSRPHISLALVETEDVDRLSRLVEAFARATANLPVRLVSLASFASEKGVLYLAPVPTRRLLAVHRELYRRLSDEGLLFDELYGPGSWVPHCTLEMGLSSSQLALAFDNCWRGFSPLDGTLIEAGVVTYPPPRTRYVTSLKGVEEGLDGGPRPLD